MITPDIPNCHLFSPLLPSVPPLSLPLPLFTQLRSIVDTELRSSMVSYQPHSDFRTDYDSLHERVG